MDEALRKIIQAVGQGPQVNSPYEEDPFYASTPEDLERNLLRAIQQSRPEDTRIPSDVGLFGLLPDSAKGFLNDPRTQSILADMELGMDISGLVNPIGMMSKLPLRGFPKVAKGVRPIVHKNVPHSIIPPESPGRINSLSQLWKRISNEKPMTEALPSVVEAPKVASPEQLQSFLWADEGNNFLTLTKESRRLKKDPRLQWASEEDIDKFLLEAIPEAIPNTTKEGVEALNNEILRRTQNKLLQYGTARNKVMRDIGDAGFADDLLEREEGLEAIVAKPQSLREPIQNISQEAVELGGENIRPELGDLLPKLGTTAPRTALELRALGLTPNMIAKQLNTSPARVERLLEFGSTQLRTGEDLLDVTKAAIEGLGPMMGKPSMVPEIGRKALWMVFGQQQTPTVAAKKLGISVRQLHRYINTAKEELGPEQASRLFKLYRDK